MRAEFTRARTCAGAGRCVTGSKDDLVTRIVAAAQASAPTHCARLEELTAQVWDGRYQPSAEAIALGLLAELTGMRRLHKSSEAC